MVLFALVFLGHLDHALQGQNSVEARRRRIHLSRKTLERRQNRAEHRLVDLHRWLHAFALNGEIRIDGAARKLFGGARPCRHFDRVPASRQPESQVEALGVNGFDFPAPRIGAGEALAASKSGHARQSHGCPSRAVTVRKRGDLSRGNSTSQAYGLALPAAGATPLPCSIPRKRATFFWCSA